MKAVPLAYKYRRRHSSLFLQIFIFNHYRNEFTQK